MSWYYIVLIVIGAIFVVLTLVVELFHFFYFGKRCDGSISICYPLPSKYKDLEVNKSYFEGHKHNRFAAYEYKAKNVKQNKGAILMAHGIGCGHFYLLPLIHRFALEGYTVLAYDAYASGCSEGKRMDCLATATRDTKFAVEYFENKYPDKHLFACGHSWGGFAVACCLHYSKRIEKAIIISGVNAEPDFISFIPFTFLIRHFMKLRDLVHYGKNGVLTIRKVLKNTDKKVMYIQGDKDVVVNAKTHGFRFKKQFENKNNIEVKMVKDKHHTPYVTLQAEESQWKHLVQFGFMGGKLVPMESYYKYIGGSTIDESVLKQFLEFLDK